MPPRVSIRSIVLPSFNPAIKPSTMAIGMEMQNRQRGQDQRVDHSAPDHLRDGSFVAERNAHIAANQAFAQGDVIDRRIRCLIQPEYSSVIFRPAFSLLSTWRPGWRRRSPRNISCHFRRFSRRLRRALLARCRRLAHQLDQFPFLHIPLDQVRRLHPPPTTGDDFSTTPLAMTISVKRSVPDLPPRLPV